MTTKQKIRLGSILTKKYKYKLKKALQLLKTHEGLINCCNKRGVNDVFICKGINCRETGVAIE